jgi:hypothetical protein
VFVGAAGADVFVGAGMDVLVGAGMDVLVAARRGVWVGAGRDVFVDLGRDVLVGFRGAAVWLGQATGVGCVALGTRVARARSSSATSCTKAGSSGLRRAVFTPSAL